MSFTPEGMPIIIPYEAIDLYVRLDQELEKLNKKGSDFSRVEEIDRLRYAIGEIVLAILSRNLEKMHLIPMK